MALKTSQFSPRRPSPSSTAPIRSWPSLTSSSPLKSASTTTTIGTPSCRPTADPMTLISSRNSIGDSLSFCTRTRTSSSSPITPSSLWRTPGRSSPTPLRSRFTTTSSASSPKSISRRWRVTDCRWGGASGKTTTAARSLREWRSRAPARPMINGRCG